MKRRAAVALGGTAALVLVGVIAVSVAGGVNDSGEQPQTTSVDAGAPTIGPPGAEGSTSPAPSPTSQTSPPTSSADPVSGSGGGSSDASGGGTQTEVTPPVNSTAPGLPESKPPADLISSRLPKSASAAGKLVSGFPSQVMPTAPDSTVQSSSVTSEGTRLQATLSAHTTRSVEELFDFYRVTLAPFGLYDSPTAAPSGSTAISFTRDTGSIVLTATTDGKGTTYVAFGSFTAPD